MMLKSLRRGMAMGALAIGALVGGGTGLAAVSVHDFSVTSLPPWGVRMKFGISGAGAAKGFWRPEFSVTVTGTTYVAKTLLGGTNFVDGTHYVYWNMAQDGITATNVTGTFRISYTQPNYYVIDLSQGRTASSTTNKTDETEEEFAGEPGEVDEETDVEEEDTEDEEEVIPFPVTYLVDAPRGGFTADEYKTTKLVLKRVAPGTYRMGTSSSGGTVTLTQPFLLGLFEVTQKQWELVMGTKPSHFPTNLASSSTTLPVESISYNDLRGDSVECNWPTKTSVGSKSFMGRLRLGMYDSMGTCVPFDLPTEAQWEYACRAGTTQAVDNKSTWHVYNSKSTTHKVGGKAANAWGFYDMHGNVNEVCRDWLGTLKYGTDPVGSNKGTYRVIRGGCWQTEPSNCASHSRNGVEPWATNATYGVRLSATLTADMVGGQTATSVAATSAAVDLATVATNSALTGALELGYFPEESIWGSPNATVWVNDKVLLTSSEQGSCLWQPVTDGLQTLVHSNALGRLVAAYTMTGMQRDASSETNSPLEKVANLSITPDEPPPFAATGAFGYLDTYTTDGSTSTGIVWTAKASVDWIRLDDPYQVGVTTNGVVGDMLGYTVVENVGVEDRVGYIYVAGQVCTVRQKGRYDAGVSPSVVEIERTGGPVAVAVTTASPDSTWEAQSTNEWLTLTVPAEGRGEGAGQATFQALPYDDTTARTGLVTVAGCTVTVIQHGARFVLDANAVTVGEQGSNATVRLRSSPGISWTAVSSATNWLTVATNVLDGFGDRVAGVGGGDVLWSVAPQTTLQTRTGTITFTPDSTEAGIATQIFTVTQEPTAARLATNLCVVSCAGGPVEVAVTVLDGVNWGVDDVPEWITVLAPTNGATSSGTARLLVATNAYVTARTGTVRIAGLAFTVEQSGTEIDAKTADRVYGFSGAMGETWAISPAEGETWTATAVSSNRWILLSPPTSGTGPATLTYTVRTYRPTEKRIPRLGTIVVSNAAQQVLQTLTILQMPEVVIDNDGKRFFIKDAWFEANPGLGGGGVDAWQKIAEGNGVKTDEAGNALPVWHDYVAGTDPTNALSRLVAHIALTPTNLLPVVTWTPALNGEGVREGARVYRVWGKVHLDDADWVEVPAGDEAHYRFFRVTVEMP